VSEMLIPLTTFDKVRNVFDRLFPLPEDFGEATDLIGDLGCDSVDIIELVMDLEETFLISIPDDEAFAWKTVGNIIKSMERSCTLPA
jgi:acyl carrier protein